MLYLPRIRIKKVYIMKIHTTKITTLSICSALCMGPVAITANSSDSSTISYTADTKLTATLGSGTKTIANNNQDTHINQNDGTQITFNLNSNNAQGACITASSDAGFIHNNDPQAVVSYQLICQDITAQDQTTLAIKPFYSSTNTTTLLDTSKTFYQQQSPCYVVIDTPLNNMYYGEYTSTFTYSILSGTCGTD